MNEYQFLIFAEKLLSLYESGEIISPNISEKYTFDFKSLIGEIKDTLSRIE